MQQDPVARIAECALAALLYEAAAEPKPGLVCPSSRGAHEDMEYFTFLASAAALAPWFGEFARLGWAFRGGEPRELLPILRGAGTEAERAMFDATRGVNTHKGLIFSLGALAAAAGLLAAAGRSVDAESCALAASAVLAGLTERDFAGLAEKAEENLSAGERLYRRWGVRGIRGEAEAGFPSVLSTALPRLRRDLGVGLSRNHAFVNALLALMTVVEDTNVLSRGGREGLAFMRLGAGRVLALGGASTPEGAAALAELDRSFTERRISPGGSADLLAVTIFLGLLERRGLEV